MPLNTTDIDLDFDDGWMATPFIGYASANLGILGTTTGTISALGTLAGSTIDATGLTPASVWSYGNRVLTIDVATKGDVYASAFM